jgi:hypothetical protein
MMTNVLIYFSILSLIYLLRFIFEFLIKLLSEEPSVMKISKYDEVFLYLSISYLITFIIIWPNV